MNARDLTELPHLISGLYSIVAKLEALAPGRKFTLDGHLVGSIGEVVASYAYGLELLRASHQAHDAVSTDGRYVQVKLTTGNDAIAISNTCDHLIVIQLHRERGFVEVYNGPGHPVWLSVADKRPPGQQRQVRLSALRRFAQEHGRDAIQRIREFPSLSEPARQVAAESSE